MMMMMTTITTKTISHNTNDKEKQTILNDTFIMSFLQFCNYYLILD